MICREEEQKILLDFLKSKRPEFLAIYGRRRVGKTYLVREFFLKKNAIFFNVTGEKDGALHDQISHFTKIIGDVFYHGISLQVMESWDKTFEVLTKAMEQIPKNKKIVLFFDEFPWMATRKSRLLQSLDYYWNQYWSTDKRIKLIICGSSASWIIDKIIRNRGGLHNRITRQIALEPFNLRDTKRFLNNNGILLNNKQIAQIYMLTGGVPYYLSLVKKGLSATQVIEDLAFKKKAPLLSEFDLLFSSLFNSFETNIAIIRAIASRRYGIGQQELFDQLDENIKGKKGLTKLKELEEAGFIMSFLPYQKKQKGIYYRVIDEYTLFYLRWIEPIKETLLKKGVSRGYWNTQQDSAAWHSWSGLAFESLCYKHLTQISNALNLSPLYLPYTWRYTPRKESKDQGAQIDLLFDRKDDSITLCEIKYTIAPFVFDKRSVKEINNKIDVFIKKTSTKKQIFLAMIASSGIKNNAYVDEYISQIVTLDDLFEKE